MLKVSKYVDNILKDWCERNLPKIVPIDWFNPKTLDELKQARKNKDYVNVYMHGSSNTIFNRDCTKHYYRAWHDTLHIKHNIPVGGKSEYTLAEIQEEELIKLGVNPWDAHLVKLDLILHIKHFEKYGKHPEYQGDLVANYLMFGEYVALNKNYSL